MTTNRTAEIAIVGAGMTGLCLAQQLQQQNKSVILLEKSRGVGGRLASRRFEGQVFDTGAQFIRARSEAFRNFLKPHVSNNTLKWWKNDEQGNPMYFGGSKMTDLPKAFAEGQSIQLNTQVKKLKRHHKGWDIFDQQNNIWTCGQLILTAPLPQSLKLLSDSKLELEPAALEKMQSISYRITLGLLAITEPSFDTQEIWTDYPDHPDLERCVHQSLKNVCQGEHGLMFHFTHEFSSRWIDASEADIQQEMIHTVQSLGFQLKASQVKKWRYADPLTTFGELAYSHPNDNMLFIGGDAFGGGSVEGAWRSAMALADVLKP